MSDFWIRFEQQVAPFDLLSHPFYQAWSRGELSAGDLREYAAEYWHHVSAFPTYLSALHARMPDGEARREVLRNLAEEEGIDAPQARAHSDLWMDFTAAFGATRAEVEARQLNAETTSLIATFRSQMEHGSTTAALAALYAYESKVPAIALTKAEGLAAHYGVEGQAARYFTLHQTADVAHASVWRGMISDRLVAAPDEQEAVLAAARQAAQALWTALDGIERQRLAVRTLTAAA